MTPRLTPADWASEVVPSVVCILLMKLAQLSLMGLRLSSLALQSWYWQKCLPAYCFANIHLVLTRVNILVKLMSSAHGGCHRPLVQNYRHYRRTTTVQDRIYIDEATKILRRNRRTLYRWKREGYGPKAFKDGMYMFYLREDVEAFLEAQTQR